MCFPFPTFGQEGCRKGAAQNYVGRSLMFEPCCKHPAPPSRKEAAEEVEADQSQHICRERPALVDTEVRVALCRARKSSTIKSITLLQPLPVAGVVATGLGM